MKHRLTNIISLLAAILLVSCNDTSNDVEVSIDNPTDKSIHIVIDDEIRIDIPAHQLAQAPILKRGRHKISIDNESKYFVANSKKIMLNPTGEVYVVVDQEYGQASFDFNTADSKSITIDSLTFYGNLRLIESDLCINTSDIDFNTQTRLPYEVKTSTFITRRKKIYRKTDFLRENKSLIQEP